MARIIVNGSKVQIATGYATAFAITNISNAATAVITCGTGHGVGSGDYFEITHCDWAALAGRAFRAAGTSATSVTVDGLDTSSTAIYPAGTITGTAKEVSGWLEVQQINTFDQSGGEQQYGNGQYMNPPGEFRFPTVKSALNISFNVDDDQTLTQWTHIKASENTLSNRTMRMLDVNNIPRMLLTGIWSRSAAPSVAINGVLKRTVSIAVAAPEVTEYTS